MSYTPVVVPTDLQGTSTGILWITANILATDPNSTDALAEGITQAGHPDPAIRATTHHMLEHAATSRAATRWTMHAALPAAAQAGTATGGTADLASSLVSDFSRVDLTGAASTATTLGQRIGTLPASVGANRSQSQVAGVEASATSLLKEPSSAAPAKTTEPTPS